jgi:hypothetical protein
VPNDIASDRDPVRTTAPKIVREPRVERRDNLLAAIQQSVEVIPLRDRLVENRTILDFVPLENRHLPEVIRRGYAR